jgi:hypothetical protein
VLSEVLEKWQDPDVARGIVTSVISGDGEAFNRLIDIDLPIPPLSRCYWLRELVEIVVPPELQEVCRLRTDLTEEERIPYFRILLRCGHRVVVDEGGRAVVDSVIPPGPCLEALRAASLVECPQEPVGGGLRLVPGPIRRYCF